MNEKFLISFCLMLCFLVDFSYSQDLRSIDEWEYFFIKSWDKEYKIAYPKSISGDSWQFYNLAYYIDANVAMYRVTQKQQYIDRALCYVENIVDSAKLSKELPYSQFKDEFLGWANVSLSHKRLIGKEIPLFESYCWRYVSDLLRIMYLEKLFLQEKYKYKYEKIFLFTKNHIYSKWKKRGMSNLKRSNIHMSSHWVKIILNLNLIQPKEEFKDFINDFLERFEKKLNSESKHISFLSWESRWDNKTGVIQDVSHGNAVVDLFVTLYELHQIDYLYIRRLSSTFKNKIWKTDREYSKYINGKGKGNGWFSDGFIKLGRYDEEIQKRLMSHKVGRSTQFFGNMALNRLFLMRSE